MADGWRKDRLPEIARSMASRPRHEALRGLVTELLREGFGAAFSELEHERYLVDNSGRIDVAWEVSDVVKMLEAWETVQSRAVSSR